MKWVKIIMCMVFFICWYSRLCNCWVFVVLFRVLISNMLFLLKNMVVMDVCLLFMYSEMFGFNGVRCMVVFFEVEVVMIVSSFEVDK